MATLDEYMKAQKPTNQAQVTATKTAAPVAPQKVAKNSLAHKNLSIQALNGDKHAQAKLKNLSYDQLSGKSLWNGYDAKSLKPGSAAYNQYRKDNPEANLSKEYDMKHYNMYNEWMKVNKPITENQRKWYQDTVARWGLNDMSNPFEQQKAALGDAEKAQLSAQDQSLNNSMATLDSNNFQAFQQLNQQMADRGMSASGISADAMARMQMGANKDYQNAFVQATQNKADIQNDFMDRRTELEQMQSDQAMQAAQIQMEDENNKMTLAQKQDEFLTQSTGTVYMNGKQLTMNGQPISTVELMKLTETQRHNIATENNISAKNLMDYQLGAEKNQITAQGNQMDYEIGMDKNEVSRQKIQADLTKHMGDMELKYAELDFDYEKLESNNLIAQEKIKQAAENAQSTKDKTQLNALGKQSADISKQIVEYQKKGKKPPKSLVEKYNNINNQISDLVGGSGFSSGGKGGGTLGSLSKKYESGSSGAGTIGNNAGDIGGKSYGTYQIATNTGTMNSFLSYAKTADPSLYKILSSHKVGSSGFDAAWKRLAKTQNSRFDSLQHKFIKKSHYDPAVSKMKSSTGIDPNSRSSALQNVVWSIGVQHGSGGANRIFKNAGIKKGDSDKTIIRKLYTERMKVDKYFSSSSRSIKNSVKSRFSRELSDALAML